MLDLDRLHLLTNCENHGLGFEEAVFVTYYYFFHDVRDSDLRKGLSSI